MESKRRGWWALAGFGVLSLLGLGGYVGAYYAMVRPFRTALWYSPARNVVPTYYEDPFPAEYDEHLRRFFTPIHQIDRAIRPGVWTEPHPSASPFVH